MKKILYIIILLFLTIDFFKAQNILPLNNSDYAAVENSYFKDINNELDPYIGTWKASFQNKIVTLFINKEFKRAYEAWGKNFYKDQLIMKYEIRDNMGFIIESNLNINYSEDNLKYFIQSLGTNIKGNNEIDFLFSGGNCGIGLGFIYVKKIAANRINWSYYPGTKTRNDINCPPNLDYTIYLPETENLIFIKQ
ncbi:DUF6705 family protein [Chryseobacterium culicis]|uniref:DUF6705 domain-containing protein n=1 Tax=Chryseobacterium culicis TaxID=680127 RepID=A0A1H6IAY0_CHRCI|nr:DUF6705 family protein [Chryseobacterium culicis]SEH43394.1 hypothetical protein SAMN05421593_4088 [Chryseobacterium culicis]